MVRFRLGKVKVKVWKNGGFGRRVGGILERPFLDQNVTKMTEVGVLRIFLENDRLWAPSVKTATPLSPSSTSDIVWPRERHQVDSDGVLERF